MYSANEAKRQVYEVIAGKLRSESLCDVDDPEFIDLAMQVQNHIAAQFEKRAAKLRDCRVVFQHWISDPKTGA